jgi:hypothetical protein
MSSDSESSKLEESKPGNSAGALTTAANDMEAATETDLPASEELTTLDNSLEPNHEARLEDTGSLREAPGTSASEKADQRDDLENSRTPCSQPAQTNNDIDKQVKHVTEMVDEVEETAESVMMRGGPSILIAASPEHAETANPEGDRHEPAMKEFVASEWDQFWQSLPAPTGISNEFVSTH